MKTKLSQIVLDALYPRRCFICDEVISPEFFFCSECNQKMKRESVKRCLGCGNRADKCECKDFIYLFDGTISPYFNNGLPKSVYYKYKFEGRGYSAVFFAEKMHESIKEHFSDISFDFITRIPKSKNTAFDHTKYLAEELSVIMSLPYKEVIAPTDKKRIKQQTLSLEDRFNNVDNAYKVTGKVKNKTVLLLDDIKTTGATLNECARRLKMAGADKVYCVSVLTGSRENEH